MLIMPWAAPALVSAAAHGHPGTLTPLQAALIPALAALTGVALGILGQAWLDRIRNRRAGRDQRDQAIAELLTATIDLVSSIQTIRAAYDTSRWRGYLRTVAAIFTAIGLAFSREPTVTPSTFLNWRKSTPFIERLLTIDRWQNEQQRTVALDLSTVLLSRTSRFYAAVAVLTLGPDKQIADAVRELTPAVTALLDLITASTRKYTSARDQANEALGKFRDIADQRQR
jgi:hypothetical protein